MKTCFQWVTPIGAVAVLTAGWIAPLAVATDLMPAAQQNALVQKYCAVCHTDAARNGGLTLEHFDAASLDPSLAAMLASKLRNGALGASGLPVPDKATGGALLNALTAEAAGAHEWTVTHSQGVVTAGIVRDLPGLRSSGEPALYRLALTCSPETRQGGMQLSWSPVSKTGTLTASIDGKATLTYQVEGEEKMGNGTPGLMGPAAITLREIALPLRTLTFSNLFPGETVVFPFEGLPAQARQTLSACFQ
jgi:hypothetical protein